MGILLYLTGVAIIAVQLIIVHALGSKLSAPQIVLLHHIGAILLLGIVALVSGIKIRSNGLRLQLIRVLLGTCRFWALVLLFAHVPLLDATALNYTQSGFLILFSTLLLGERPTPVLWFCTLTGFLGALLVIRPAFAAVNAYYLIGLVAPAVSALTTVATKATFRGDHVNTTFFGSRR